MASLGRDKSGTRWAQAEGTSGFAADGKERGRSGFVLRRIRGFPEFTTTQTEHLSIQYKTKTGRLGAVLIGLRILSVSPVLLIDDRSSVDR